VLVDDVAGKICLALPKDAEVSAHVLHRAQQVVPGRYCPLLHPTHVEPLFLELNGIL